MLPEYHGRGIGSQLLRHAIGQVDATREIRLEFVAGNEHAKSFYERHGFAPDFEEDPGDGSITVWMRRPAHLEHQPADVGG